MRGRTYEASVFVEVRRGVQAVSAIAAVLRADDGNAVGSADRSIGWILVVQIVGGKLGHALQWQHGNRHVSSMKWRGVSAEMYARVLVRTMGRLVASRAMRRGYDEKR